MPFGKQIQFYDSLQQMVPFYDDVILFMNMSAPNGFRPSNQTFDRSKYGRTFSTFGANIAVSTAEFATTPSSLFVTNSTDDGIYGTGTSKSFIYTNNDSVFNMGTGSFTIEGWVLPRANGVFSTVGGVLMTQCQMNNNTSIQQNFWSVGCELTNSNQQVNLRIGSLQSAAWNFLLTATGPNPGGSSPTWSHFAITRQSFATGSTWHFFNNGRRMRFTIDAGGVNGSMPNWNGTVAIGTSFRNLGWSFMGWIDGLIWTKNVAKYIDNFVPEKYNE